MPSRSSSFVFESGETTTFAWRRWTRAGERAWSAEVPGEPPPPPPPPPSAAGAKRKRHTDCDSSDEEVEGEEVKDCVSAADGSEESGEESGEVESGEEDDHDWAELEVGPAALAGVRYPETYRELVGADVCIMAAAFPEFEIIIIGSLNRDLGHTDTDARRRGQPLPIGPLSPRVHTRSELALLCLLPAPRSH